MRFHPSLLLLALAGGCTSKSTTDSALYEGDDAGDCTDGADDDRDGYFDCADNGCWGSPDCVGDSGDAGVDSGDSGTDSDSAQDSGTDTGSQDSGTDTGTDTATDTDTGGTAAVASEFTTFTLTYSLQWDFYDAYDDVIESYGLSDCVAEYSASGTQVSAEGDSVTFDGPWTLSGGDCPTAQTDPASVIWYSKSSGEAYATFTFSDDLSTLDDWVQHKNVGDTDPLESPSSHGQWYLTDMAAPFDATAGEATYSLVESTTIDGLIPLDLTHTMTVTFGR